MMFVTIGTHPAPPTVRKDMLFQGALFALSVGLVAATPSPSSVGSDLSLLIQNDLNCKSNVRHGM